MSAAVLLGAFAAVYFWFPKMFGRMMNETLGKLHFTLTLATVVVTFGLQLLLGYAGMQRRLPDPSAFAFLRPLAPLNRVVSSAAFVMGAAQVLFVINFFYSLVRGPRAASNPWEVGTLDWTVASPPPHHNFDRIPTVTVGPHEIGNPRVKEALGRDWLGQDEELPP
jgi:cytochrome c oxidase subunit 1